MESRALPLVIKVDNLSPDQFVSWYIARKAEFEKRLEENGAIKFTGVQIDSIDRFQAIVDAISSKFLNYIDGNSPRTKLSGHVYTSTEYDSSQKITMHNELSYSAKWPNKLFFSCLQPAETGGETLLADSRAILRSMDKTIVAAIEEKGVLYIRNLHGGQGMGPSWQETFETEDRAQLESYCNDYNIEYAWTGNNNLRLLQRSRGVIGHRKNKDKLWFNQIDQFHPCHLGEEILEAMTMMYDSPDDFPMYVRFGDGQEIGEELVRQILDTIETVTIAPAWNKNELLIVDNELVSHGRNAFSGPRKVLVAMSE